MASAEQFIANNSFDVRKAESSKMLAKYPDRVPVVLFAKDVHDSSGKYKFLFPRDFSCGQAVSLFRKRTKLQPHEALFLFTGISPETPYAGGYMPPSQMLLDNAHKQWAHEDGFLYIVIRPENTFGMGGDGFQERAEQIVQALRMSAAEIETLEQAEQRTDTWHAGRRPTVPGIDGEPLKLARVTASVCGSCVGMNPYKSANALAKDLVYGSQMGNHPALAWGTALEPVAESVYAGIHPTHKIDHPGLRVCKSMPWLGGSPDGLITTAEGERAILEIKCPYSQKLYDGVPPQYFCQIQLCMWLFDAAWTDFVVMCPTLTEITRVPYDAQFVTERLLPGIHNFYFGTYLPAVMRKERGLLAEGTLSPMVDLHLNIPLYLDDSDCSDDSETEQ